MASSSDAVTKAHKPPTPDEVYGFHTTGYLTLPGFLTPDHVTQLTNRLGRVIERRRQLELAGVQARGQTEIDGSNTRIFHILEDDQAFLDLINYAPLMPYVQTLLCQHPHFHASDAIWEVGPKSRPPKWHPDGGYLRVLTRPTPLMQLKVGYYLSDMSDPDQGNLMLVPGSHRSEAEPSTEQQAGYDTMPGAFQVCGPPGTAVIFHNAVWHTGGPSGRPQGQRIMLYYAYEHGFMLGNPEHWGYSKEFYAGLTPEQRLLFHGFVFDPPEWRWS